MLPMQALSSSLNAGTAKAGCLGREKAFGSPPAVCPPQRSRSFTSFSRNLTRTLAAFVPNFFRRRTNVQQLTCNIDLSSSFYYLFFSFVLLELKPFVCKWKVLGEKFWKVPKSVKKCENYETILPFSCCPLVFPWFFGPQNREEKFTQVPPKICMGKNHRYERFAYFSNRIMWTKGGRTFLQKCPRAGTGTKINFPSQTYESLNFALLVRNS